MKIILVFVFVSLVLVMTFRLKLTERLERTRLYRPFLLLIIIGGIVYLASLHVTIQIH